MQNTKILRRNTNIPAGGCRVAKSGRSGRYICAIIPQLVLIFGPCICTREISNSAISTSAISTSAISTSAVITVGINTSAIITRAIYLCILSLGANKQRLWMFPVIQRFLMLLENTFLYFING